MKHLVVTDQAIGEFEAWGLLIAGEILALEHLKPVSSSYQLSSEAFPELREEYANINSIASEMMETVC